MEKLWLECPKCDEQTLHAKINIISPTEHEYECFVCGTTKTISTMNTLSITTEEFNKLPEKQAKEIKRGLFLALIQKMLDGPQTTWFAYTQVIQFEVLNSMYPNENVKQAIILEIVDQIMKIDQEYPKGMHIGYIIDDLAHKRRFNILIKQM